MRPVFVAGVGLWIPGFPTPAAWIEDRYDPVATDPPSVLLQSRLGRFTSLVTRMAVSVVEQAAARSGVDLSRVPTVFGSAYGEIRTAFEQLDMIEREGVVSPARFKNSVHNTASGHLAIATGNMKFSTALAAGRATFAMCLLEAWAWLELRREPVMVAVADEALPDHLSGVGRYEPLGIALYLCAQPPAAGALGRLSGLSRRDCDPQETNIPDSLRGNPCASGLLLVKAIFHGRRGTVPVELGDCGFSVHLDFVQEGPV